MLEGLLGLYIPVAIIVAIMLLISGGSIEDIISKSLLWPAYVLKILLKTIIKLLSEW